MHAPDFLPFKKEAFTKIYDGLVIVEKPVMLEAELISFQDINWGKTAEGSATKSRTMEKKLESLLSFAQNMRNYVQYVERTTRDHLGILQSICTQSNSLRSAAQRAPIG